MFSNKKRKDAEEDAEKKSEDSILDSDVSSGKVHITVTSKDSETKAEKPTKKKNTALKFLTVASTVAMLSFSVYCISVGIYNASNRSDNDDGYLTLLNTNYSNSRISYERFGFENKGKLRDYAIIGNKLFLSENKITADCLTTEDSSNWISSAESSNFSLFNLTSEAHEAHRTDFASGRNYIDLSACEEGDYLVYPQSTSNKPSNGPYKDIHPYSILSSKTISMTFYSLPNKDGTRKRIRFRNNSQSPFTLITIQNCGSELPSGYYDAVIAYQEYDDLTLSRSTTPGTGEQSAGETIAKEISAQTDFRVKFENSIESTAKSNAPLSIFLAKDMNADYISSVFIDSVKASVLEDGYLKGYDRNPEIRELVGYLDQAGKSYRNVIGNDILSPVENRIGKESYLLNIQNQNDIRKSVVEFLNRIV